jgi:TRAP-type C4-dicarboxylate transport system substrate-binding protein
MRTAKSLAMLALGATLLAATPAAAAEWSFNNNYAPTRAELGFVRDFAADVGKRTDGALTVRVFEGGAMNLPDADALRWMQVGTPELGFVWPPFLGRDAPTLASVYVFGSVADAAEHQRALPAWREILAPELGQRNIAFLGLMGLPMLDAHLLCTRPVKGLEELRGVSPGAPARRSSCCSA